MTTQTEVVPMDLSEGIEKIAKRYPTRRSAIMPSLFLAQEKYAQLTGEVMREVAEILDVPEIWVFEVATFYAMYHTDPVGKYHIQVCTNVSCLLLEAEDLLAHLEKKLGIACGDTTPDGRFTLSSVECLGSCDTAPVMQVNNDPYHEYLSQGRIDEVLDELGREERK